MTVGAQRLSFAEAARGAARRPNGKEAAAAAGRPHGREEMLRGKLAGKPNGRKARPSAGRTLRVGRARDALWLEPTAYSLQPTA